MVGLAPEGPLVRGCLQRMVAWSKVVQEVAATEFPDWELLGAFAVFRLEEPPARARHAPRPTPTPIDRAAQDCLRQLANAFRVDFRQLREEFQDHQRLAQGHKKHAVRNLRRRRVATCGGQHTKDPQHPPHMVCEGLAACPKALLR